MIRSQMIPTTLIMKRLIDHQSASVRFGDLVLFNDHQIIACAKPAGMPTQEDKTGDPSLHRLAQAYCKRDLYVVHRLDRPCSGLVVFAKTKNAASQLSAGLAKRSVEKKYLAVVPNGMERAEGTLSDFIVKIGAGKVRVSDDESEGKNAHLTYKTVSKIDNYTLIEITPSTGRLHQIRAQLSAYGFPVKGDVKYGSRRKNKDRSIHLHSYSMTLRHPTKGQDIRLICPLPDETVWNAFEF
jgi:23S rRNA pseudouridine1911/1915/1917 synthase